jgi:hypothetical protein
VSITSLGGTPAYAEGCTFKSTFTFAKCRNTDQGDCSGSSHIDLLAYHALDVPTMPAGYALHQFFPTSGTCCTQMGGSVQNPYFEFPNTVKCLIRYRIYSNNGQQGCGGGGTSNLDYDFVYGAPGPGGTTVPTDVSPITINMTCPPQGHTPSGIDMANDFWTIYAVCNSKAAPDSCYA